MITQDELARLLELPAGEELDRAVAEWVFGSRVEDIYESITDLEFAIELRPNGDEYGVPLPHFSTTGDGMLLVIEEMGRYRYILESLKQSTDLTRPSYSATLMWLGPANVPVDWYSQRNPFVEASGETAPLAVCRAALRAVAQEAA